MGAAQRTGLPIQSIHLILSGLKVSTMKLSIIFGSALLVVAVASMDPARKSDDVAVAERMLPLAYYAGTAVAPEIYTSLVAAYGAWMVIQYNIRQKTASSAGSYEGSVCGGRGRCKRGCHQGEYRATWAEQVCVTVPPLKCCMPSFG